VVRSTGWGLACIGIAIGIRLTLIRLRHLLPQAGEGDPARKPSRS